VAWEDEFLRNLSRIARGHLADPTLFDLLERRFWLDLWRTPVLDAVEEERIEARWYGPIQVTVVANLPETSMLNLLLGAAEPGAVEEGHLVAALEWVESLGIECRIPITAGRPEAGAAEDLLNQRGYQRGECLVRYVRDTAAPDFPKPAGVEIDEVDDYLEGFSEYIGDAFALDPIACCLFDGLPRRHLWRCYVALDENEVGVGSAVMMLDDDIAQLGFAATEGPARGKGCHLALLRRRIRDAAAAGCHALFAETEESLDDLGHPSQAARNLVRAGFKRAMIRPVWRPVQPVD
jgi:GNAT superfamily N-acetyltransferase